MQHSFRALEKIATHLNNENVRSVGFSHIRAVLEQLNLECEAMKNIEKIEQGKFEESEELPPNTKLKLQFRPKLMYHTLKKRKASETLSGPSFQEMKEIKSRLMGEDIDITLEES